MNCEQTIKIGNVIYYCGREEHHSGLGHEFTIHEKDIQKHEQAAAELVALKVECYEYRKRVSALENIIQAARNGEYDNAHEINAIRAFLRKSMDEYYSTLKGETK